jgi:phenylalanyl-tRNA synthetase beta chain
MTVVSMNRKEVEKRIGKISAEVENKIAMFGTPIESLTDEILEIDVTPNRPDLLSTQGFVRAMIPYLKDEKLKPTKVNKPEKDFKVIIDKSVKSVRPFTACAIVKNLKLDDSKIKELIDIQEKLHTTFARKRKKLAIGIYPLEKIKLPITFCAKKPEEIRFQPLEFPREISGLQILSQHPAGREYAHLLEGQEKFPVFIDANKKVLSMPPIINSHETGKISEKTKDVFIECSGFNLAYLKKTLNILVAIFADMGGDIYQMKVEDKDDYLSPDWTSERVKLKLDDVNRTLGLKLTEKEVKRCLEKMQIEYENGVALIPPYRIDILHWIDLVGDISIGYGFENFVPEIPKISTIGEEDSISKMKGKIANILTGLGLLECSSYHLNTKEDVLKNDSNFKGIEVEESKTEYNTLRSDLLTNSLKILSENSDSSYPQRIFETGRIFKLDQNNVSDSGILELEHLSISLTHDKVNFTEIKQILDYLFKMLNREYTIAETEDNALIPGRSGKIMINNKQVGIIGEVHPRVLKNWNINMPVVVLELNIESLL